MWNTSMLLYIAVLFFVLTPGILLSLPPGGSKFTVAAVHGVVFALVFHFTHKIVWNSTKNVHFGNLESFESVNKGSYNIFSDSNFNSAGFPANGSYVMGNK